MDGINFIIDSWQAVARVVFVGSLAFFALVLLIRASTKRSLAQLSAFDFVITVALGSAFGRILTATEVGLAEALTAFVLLISLQYIIAIIETRSPRFAYLVKASPTLVYYRGEFLRDAMRKDRVSEAELEGAVRQAGLGSWDEVEAIVFESGGDFAVIPKDQAGNGSTFTHLDTR